MQDASSRRGGTRSTTPDSTVPVTRNGKNASVKVAAESRGDLVRSKTRTVSTTAETTCAVIAVAAAANSARNSGTASAAR